MQSRVRIIVSTFLLTSALANAYHSSTKLRRDGVLNLYPFPRVGRSSRHTWQLPIKEYSEYEPMEKRQLYAFPRVGRSAWPLLQDPYSDRLQMQMPAEAPSMWFGPRLGRSFKSDEDDISIGRQNADNGAPEQIDSLQNDRKKRHAQL